MQSWESLDPATALSLWLTAKLTGFVIVGAVGWCSWRYLRDVLPSKTRRIEHDRVQELEDLTAHLLDRVEFLERQITSPDRRPAELRDPDRTPTPRPA